jgi:hypothetical protein
VYANNPHDLEALKQNIHKALYISETNITVYDLSL